jgi:succinoglycan biosynthesis transport protein ExoP
LGGLVGIVVGLALSVVRESRDQRLRSADAIQRDSGIAVLAMVPKVRRPTRMAGPDLSDKAPVAEAYRQLRTRVLAPDPGLPRSLLVASPVAGDGKTTTACYLAAALARAHRRVALVEGDMRHPRLARVMGLPGRAGLVDVLSKRMDLNSAMQPWDQRHLHVLTAGEPTSQPSELLASQTMVDLMKELHRSYEFVIVDSPPITTFTDAEILSTLVDNVLLVLRYAGTPEARAEEAVHNLSLVNARMLGAVITMVPPRVARHLRFPSGTPTAERAPQPASASLQGESARELYALDGWKDARVGGGARVPDARVPEGGRPHLHTDTDMVVPTVGHSPVPGPTATPERSAGNERPADHGEG